MKTFKEFLSEGRARKKVTGDGREDDYYQKHGMGVNNRKMRRADKTIHADNHDNLAKSYHYYNTSLQRKDRRKALIGINGKAN
jgi:hypothetical protein